MIKYYIISTRLYPRLTSSMPLMNPFGSFSISMFGFSFILDRRRTTDQDVQAILIHTCDQYLPARLASSAARPPFLSNDLIGYFWESLRVMANVRGYHGTPKTYTKLRVKSFQFISQSFLMAKAYVLVFLKSSFHQEAICNRISH